MNPKKKLPHPIVLRAGEALFAIATWVLVWYCIGAGGVERSAKAFIAAVIVWLVVVAWVGGQEEDQE